ncbi:hypothetical protein CNMCM5793_003364 [Aspergillus hiratsukae]|uniref:Uncharacterized protein n=1 Tax=Aspergillus hiratsukae TaxID=1194566 RepID=A0A8H6PDT4_9EURO|nr:hypothetical protein CNMCM5793_003364 [Aspergillus hiratsukae]
MYSMYPLLPLLLTIVPVRSFSLNTPTKHWNYTTASLVSSTSQECKDAYSADIACDDFLLALAVSKEDRWWLPPDFDSASFDRTCTATCQSSLAEYVAHVEKRCNKASDAALKTKPGDNWSDLGVQVYVPVVTLGHILQYTLMRSCTKDDDGSYCYVGQSMGYYIDCDCDYTCALAYFWVAHEYPYDDYSFGLHMASTDNAGNRIELISSSVLFDDMQDWSDGWKTVEKCGWTKNDTLPLFSMGMSKKAVEQSTNSTATAATAAGSSMVKSTGVSAVTSASAQTGAGESIRMHVEKWMTLLILAIGVVVL